MSEFAVTVKYHFIYKTANLVNGKFYIGKHSTSNLDDGYLGSGKLLVKAIKKYGKDRFGREILLYCPNEAELDAAERNLLTMNLIQDEKCYNLATGGEGGMILKHITPTELANKAAATLKSRPERLAARNSKIRDGQLAHLAKNPTANDERLKKMNALCRGSKKENNPGIQKQVENRRTNHVRKMNALMTRLAEMDWMTKDVKPLIAALGISGSTFGRMKKRLLNGQKTWE